MEEGRYRLSRPRERKTLAEEMAKFSLCFALSEHSRASGSRGGKRAKADMDIASIKAGMLSQAIRAGDEVGGEAIACDYAAVYSPRAFYPTYVLGEMRAALRRGESPPDASPHYLPVSTIPPLPDGSRVVFLYGRDKTAFDRPDFPAHVRDVLTRDYLRMPLLLPPQQEAGCGRVRFRARVMQLDPDSVCRLAGLGERAYQAYAARGLTHFLRPLALEVEDATPPLRGSLFAELSFRESPAWELMAEALEGALRAVVDEVFPPCARGEREEPGGYLPCSGFQVSSFRRRLLALVYDPAIAVFRAPHLLGLYLPCDLMGERGEPATLFEEFVLRLAGAVQGHLGLDAPPRIEIAYDNRLAWVREGGALRGPSSDALQEEHPSLRPTIEWLRGY